MKFADMKALVYKSTGSWYSVKDERGQMYNARIKGVMKIEGITSTNPVAVGDLVEIEKENDADQTAMIISIKERHNYINRQSPRGKHQHHIIAANVDQSILIATLKDPRTSQGFIDRFLVACEAFHVPAIIVFNKADVYKQKEKALYEERRKMYEAIGYRVMLTSSKTKEGIPELYSLLKDKVSLFTGHSGVGKSTIINELLPDLGLKTQEVSGWSGKGMHTTTFAEMFDLPSGGSIIDTPGMREFGLVDISRQELSHYFPEMRRLIQHCQFNNCLHINEPECAVKGGVVEGIVSEDRYVSYYNILESIDDKTY